MQRRLVTVLSSVAVLGCADAPAPQSDLAPATLAVRAVTAMPLAGPRANHVIVPGEPIRVVARIHGGTPPYAIELRPPLRGRTTIRPDTNRAELAFETAVPAAATAGVAKLAIAATDAAGATAVGGADIAIADVDRHVDPIAHVAPYVQVMDRANRVRSGGYRGEALDIAVDLGVAPALPATVTVRGPGGEIVATASIEMSTARVPMLVPPLAVAGEHRIDVTSRSGVASAMTWRVLGAPFAPAHVLTIDQLRLWGGPAAWSTRAATLTAGEPIRVVARVGGARGELSGTLALRDAAGVPVASLPLPAVTPRSQLPTARTSMERAFDVPRVPPGRYVLEVHVVQNDQVAVRRREVQVDR